VFDTIHFITYFFKKGDKINMIFTVTISELALLLAAIAFFLLVVYLIPAIIQLRNTTKAVKGAGASEGR